VPAPTAAGGGWFSPAQAERGRTSFESACGECHAPSELVGAEFEWRWRRQTAWHLYREIETTMPENRPGALAPQVYADIVAYVLDLNDYQAGSDELAPTREALEAIPLGAGAAKTRPSP
jgi:hypothetical protein